MKNTLSLFTALILASCKTTYQTTEFSDSKSPKAPDYSNESSWAVLPETQRRILKDFEGVSDAKKADVFYIYPTLLVDKKDSSWNADIFDSSFRQEVIEKAVTYQASAWVKAANLYVPYYRQAHYRIFVEPYASQGTSAGELAYQDVKAAFEYYLKHYNNSKPIILAAHSQGAIHAKRLLNDFFDGTSLKKQLVAAYLIGTKMNKEQYKNLPLLTYPEQVGGFVSWNTYKINHLPKNYENWYKGGVVTNPITWDGSEVGSKELHKGVLGSDKKIYPRSLSVKKTDGMLWSTLPKIKNRFLLSFIKNYHFADVNLFWKDIQENAVLRTQKWLNQNVK